jgi:hypothetical protein
MLPLRLLLVRGTGTSTEHRTEERYGGGGSLVNLCAMLVEMGVPVSQATRMSIMPTATFNPMLGDFTSAQASVSMFGVVPTLRAGWVGSTL